MNNIEIAANAPTEAKYFGVIDDGPSGTELYLDGDLASCVKVWYLDDDSTWVEGDFDSFCIYGFKEFRSLSDIHRNVELEKRLQEVTNTLAVMVSVVTGKAVILPEMRTRQSVEYAVRKFAIEHQIQAIEDFKSECGMFVPTHKLKDKIGQLRQSLNESQDDE